MADDQSVNLAAGDEAVETQNLGGQQGEPAAEQTQPKTYTQEELDKTVQAEADRCVNQALNTFKEKELPSLLEGAKSEAEKLAKMNAEQKAEHEKKKAEEALMRREAELTRKELRIEAHKTLTEKGLPVELLDALQYGDAESCSASIEAVEKAFRAAVEKGVNDRIRGTSPGASAAPATLTLDSIKNMSQAEIMANMAEIEKTLAAKR